MFKHRFLTGTALAALAFVNYGCKSVSDPNIYKYYPVTVSGYKGSKDISVAYTGQIARHVLHDSLKKLAGQGDGYPNDALKSIMTSYYAKTTKNREILAPTSKGVFKIKQTNIDKISKKKNLSGKTYKGTITGMPRNMNGPELVNFWIGKASSAKKGVDTVNGYNYPQLISKFIMGAVSYNQAVDNYLDEKLGADKKPNDKPYKKGAHYTGKEHSWDEAFGYFGAPAHTMTLTAKQVYNIAKRKKEGFAAADYDEDGVVDLKTEMTFGPAYYAAGFDKGGKTNYLHTIMSAYIEGRKVITAAGGKKLTNAQRNKIKGSALVIAKNWERVLAEATFKYAGSVYKDMGKVETIIEAKGNASKAMNAYIKHWGELKGFSLALQTGNKKLGATGTKLNRLVGFGPLMPDLSQVTNIDRKGNYVRGKGVSWKDYRQQMADIQKLMIKKFGVKARAKGIKNLY